MEFTLAQVNEAIAEQVADRECLVWRDQRVTWGQFTERTRRLGNFLHGRGLGAHTARAQLHNWQSGQDHVGLYMYNSPEFLESMMGAYKGRLAPFNVNYRYVEEELAYLFTDAHARAVIYHSTFAPTLARVLPQLPHLDVLIQVPDDSQNALLPNATWYEDALASASPEQPDTEWSPDDLYILYTGGTTGRPKGVLWRQADIFPAALGGRRGNGEERGSVEEIVARAQRTELRVMPIAPFMHAAHWAALDALLNGGTVVMQHRTDHLDADDILSTAARERVNLLLIVGDAFGRPLLDQLRQQPYDLSHLKFLVTGGAALNATVKQGLLECFPDHVRIIDTVGSSEAGAQASHISTKGKEVSTGTFTPRPGSCILSEDMSQVLAPGHEGIGWLAQAGRVPLGYLGDQAKTERTFPTIDGTRYAIPGDRARLRADGIVEMLGRDSVTINSGGEKIFAEEVEHAIKQHPAVLDAVVCGRPSERWGNEVVAIVQLRPKSDASPEVLREECAKHLARYKLPKAVVYRDTIVRSPSGKADYRWAAAQAVETTAAES